MRDNTQDINSLSNCGDHVKDTSAIYNVPVYYDDSTLVSFLCMFLFSGLEQRQINSVYNGLAFNIYRVDFVFSLIRSAI